MATETRFSIPLPEPQPDIIPGGQNFYRIENIVRQFFWRRLQQPLQEFNFDFRGVVLEPLKQFLSIHSRILSQVTGKFENLFGCVAQTFFQ